MSSLPITHNSKQIKALIFDVDGTLTESISWLDLTQCIGADTTVHNQFYLDLYQEKITIDQFNQQLTALWLASNHANKSDILAAIKNWPIKPGITDLFTYLNPRYTTCLISGSFDLYIEHLANTLPTHHWFSNGKLYFDDHQQLTSFHLTQDQSSLKLQQMYQLCDRLDITPDQVAAIGDGFNDLGLFQNVGLKIAIKSPSNKPELLELADHILDTPTQLTEIL